MECNNYARWEHGFLVLSEICPSIVLEGNNLSTLNQAFIKIILGNQAPKTFPVGTIHKSEFLTSKTPATSKCQRYRVDWWSNQTLFSHYQHAKMQKSFNQYAQFINSCVRYS